MPGPTMTTSAPEDGETGALRRAALAYAARGWHVLPLRPGDKRPAFPDHPADACTGTDPRCRAGHTGWEQRATTDPDRITRAWSAPTTRDPYGVGIACGPSHLVVLDLDTPKSGHSLPEEWRMPGVVDGGDVLVVLATRHGQTVPDDTYTVTTGRGGTHLYFTHPFDGGELRNTAGFLGPLIDTRAHGGYVVAPPAAVHGRRYRLDVDRAPAELPGWLADLLHPTSAPPSGHAVVALDGAHRQAEARRRAYLDAAVRAQVAQVHGALDGTRNRALYLSAVALGQLVAGGALGAARVRLVLLDAAVEHIAAGAYTRRQAEATIGSGLHAGAARPRSIDGGSAA